MSVGMAGAWATGEVSVGSVYFAEIEVVLLVVDFLAYLLG
jgi:hypothetical protein